MQREIANNYRTADCEFWLKWVYSYSKKIELYQRKLQEKNASLSIVEPTKPIEREVKGIKRLKYKIQLARYTRKLKQYNKNKAKRGYYEAQLRNCEIHNAVIELFRQRKVDEGKELLKNIEQDDFQIFYPRYKEITFNKLFNMNIEADRIGEESLNYREKSILLQKISKSVAVGCLSLAVMTSLALDFKSISFMSFVYMLMNLITMLWFVYNGIKSADSLVFGSMMQADANRIKVSNLYRDDCIKNGDTWVKSLKDNNIHTDGEINSEKVLNIEQKRE